jgi:hypothetical protein
MAVASLMLKIERLLSLQRAVNSDSAGDDVGLY